MPILPYNIGEYLGGLLRLPRLLSCLIIIITGVYALPLGAAQSDELELKKQQAGEALVNENFDEAIALYQELLESSPGDVSLTGNLGVALFYAERYGEAEANFEAVSKNQPQNARAWFFLGMSVLEQGRIQQALSSLRKTVELDPSDLAFRFQLANVLFSEGLFAEAITHYEILSQSKADDPEILYSLVLAYSQLSGQSLMEADSLAPTSGYVFALLARSQIRRKRYESAFNLYKQSLKLHPGLPGIHTQIARIYKETGHEDWAAVETKREQELPPPDCSTHPLECLFVDGRFHEILEATKDLNTVEAHFWRSTACDDLADMAIIKLLALPPSAASHQLKADQHLLEGRNESVAEEWQEALKLKPDDPVTQLGTAKALRLISDYKEAERLLAGLLASEPDNSNFNYLMGDTLMELQEAKRAVPYLEKSVEITPGIHESQSVLGRAYLQIGESEKAIPYLEKSLEKDEDGSLHYLLAQAYRLVGRQQEAKEVLKKRQVIIKASRASTLENDRKYTITPP